MSDNIVTPVGRIVSGSLTEKRTTDYEGKPVPEEKQNYQFGVAFRKDDPAIQGVMQYLQGVAMTQHAHNPSVTSFNLQGYSWKVRDGDTPGRDGQVSNNTAGHWVFYFSSSYPINTCDASNAPIDAAQCYRGAFVDLVMNAVNNGKQGSNEGLFLNPVWVRKIAEGERITGGVDAATAFAGHAAPTALPPGASATPVAPAAPAAGMMQPQGMSGMPQGNAAPAPRGMPQPAHDFVNNAAPAPQGMPGLPQG